jgi:hypothetical protein
MTPLSSSFLLRLTARDKIRRGRTPSCRDRIFSLADEQVGLELTGSVTSCLCARKISWKIPLSFFCKKIAGPCYTQETVGFLTSTTFARGGSAEPNNNFKVAQLQDLNCRVTHLSFIMTVMSAITTSLLGYVLLSSGALALGRSLVQKEDDPGATNVSSAKCTVVSIGYSENKNLEQQVIAGEL